MVDKHCLKLFLLYQLGCKSTLNPEFTFVHFIQFLTKTFLAMLEPILWWTSLIIVYASGDGVHRQEVLYYTPVLSWSPPKNALNTIIHPFAPYIVVSRLYLGCHCSSLLHEATCVYRSLLRNNIPSPGYRYHDNVQRQK